VRVRAAFAVALVLALFAPAAASNAQVVEKQDGISFTGWWNDLYDGAPPEEAMTNLADTGAGWVSILVTWYQDTADTTQIRPTENTPTDEGVIHMIQTAHDLGLAVMLKPHVDLSGDPYGWRAEIGTHWKGQPAKWDRWFRSYRHFIFHFAVLAEAQGVEQFSVGCELIGTTGRAARWRDVVAGVRSRFSGTLTYASNWGGEEVGLTWWDAVDLIGVDAYYPLTDKNDPTVQEIEDGWADPVQTLSDLSAAWDDKSIIFTEVGYRSVDGTARHPWDWVNDFPLDLQEQADCYEALFASLWDQSWFAGMYIWDWSADPTLGGPTDKDFTPFGKPAEDILRAQYSAPA
jgi:hypothetical protein